MVMNGAQQLFHLGGQAQRIRRWLKKQTLAGKQRLIKQRFRARLTAGLDISRREEALAMLPHLTTSINTGIRLRSMPVDERERFFISADFH